MNEPDDLGDQAKHSAKRADERLAFKRWIVLNLVRLVGVTLVFTGIAVLERALALPPVSAYVLTIIGFLTFFFLPNFIAKGWRSEDA